MSRRDWRIPLSAWNPASDASLKLGWPRASTWAWGYLGFSAALLALSVPFWCFGLIAFALLLSAVDLYRERP